VGPIGLLYMAMARPKVVANAQPVSPDSVESAALNTVTDAELLKEVSPQSSDQTSVDVVEQPTEQMPSAELESKPIAQEQQPTPEISTAQESQSLVAAVEPRQERWAAPDVAAEASTQANAVEQPSPQTQSENETAQDQSQETKDSQLPGAKNESETAQADAPAGETADQTGETIDIARAEKKLEES
jgi:hypothetical protein